MKICPKCGTSHEKSGIFCSRKCANSRVWSETDKQKKSNSLKQNIAKNPVWRQEHVDSITARVAVRKVTVAARNKKLFYEGKITTREALKKQLIEEHGEQCDFCGISSTWQGQYLSLQVDHIDGNSKNNLPSNLRLLCPNCHSQTETFSGKKHRNKPL
jgi:hypothetical protein